LTEIESSDRLYLNVYVPELQRVGQVVGFLTRHLGFEIASTALVAKRSEAFVAGLQRYAADHGVPLIDFVKGQRKDDVMYEHLARCEGSEQVLFIGRAQEKARVFRTERRIGFTALDNGFATIEDPAEVVKVQAICDGLTEPVIDALLRKWLARLPHPFTPADRAAGYRYQLSVLQAEFSLTQMLDKPVSDRIFFEQTIRENLDIGRPDQVSLIFNRQVRRTTPGVFRTRVITDTVTPSLHIDYKHCRIKQYHKEGKALRTETTINDTYDFAIGKRLTNLPALREIGFSANRRLLGV
jgi:hypothetical protein